jgi:hypothetical protein
MVKITDKTDYSRFIRPTGDDEGIWLVCVSLTCPTGCVTRLNLEMVARPRHRACRWTFLFCRTGLTASCTSRDWESARS